MDDLISRQAAIEALEFGITYAKAINKETGEVKELFQASNDELRKAEDRIKQLPSAQRTGRWIDGKVKHIKNGELRNVRECSECGSSYFVYDYYNSVDEIPKFCPNCGARMEEKECET